MNVERPLRLHEGHGLELELVIVDDATLDVRPIADRLLFEASGDESGDHDAGRISWSNELVLHCLELKTSTPERQLDTVAEDFQANVRAAEALLAAHGARLMPTGMHPWMDPVRETVLWPHAYGEVYRAFDRVFDCRRHGWANLQSVHLNLSFGDDAEFGCLHAAVRLVLPLLPALAASSPVMDGRVTGLLDNRLEVYRTNSARVPRMTGAVIPEPLWTAESYRHAILEPLQADAAALDGEGVLEGEWLNARGAIARFDRSAIEIRLLDTQECPVADVAVASAVAAVVRALCRERWCSAEVQRAFAVEPLAELLCDAIRSGPAARVSDRAYARALGWRRDALPTAGELWDALIESCVAPETTPALVAPLELVQREGTLAQRIVKRLGPDPDRRRLRSLYQELCDCLRTGVQLQG